MVLFVFSNNSFDVSNGNQRGVKDQERERGGSLQAVGS